MYICLIITWTSTLTNHAKPYNRQNIFYKSKITAQGNIHIGDLYQINGQPREIPLQLNTIPFIDKSEVIGRNKDLQSVNELLQVSDKVVLVNGLGGIGKTVLAKFFIA